MLLQFMSHELNVAEFATGNQRLCSIWQCWLLILQVAAGFSFHTREQFQFISRFARGEKKKKSQLILRINPFSVIRVLKKYVLQAGSKRPCFNHLKIMYALLYFQK